MCACDRQFMKGAPFIRMAGAVVVISSLNSENWQFCLRRMGCRRSGQWRRTILRHRKRNTGFFVSHPYQRLFSRCWIPAWAGEWWFRACVHRTKKALHARLDATDYCARCFNATTMDKHSLNGSSRNFPFKHFAAIFASTHADWMRFVVELKREQAIRWLSSLFLRWPFFATHIFMESNNSGAVNCVMLTHHHHRLLVALGLRVFNFRCRNWRRNGINLGGEWIEPRWMCFAEEACNELTMTTEQTNYFYIFARAIDIVFWKYVALKSRSNEIASIRSVDWSSFTFNNSRFWLEIVPFRFQLPHFSWVRPKYPSFFTRIPAAKESLVFGWRIRAEQMDAKEGRGKGRARVSHRAPFSWLVPI